MDGEETIGCQSLIFVNSRYKKYKEIKISTVVGVTVPVSQWLGIIYNWLTDLKLDHVFNVNIIVYCQQNRYFRFAIQADLEAATVGVQ